MTTPTGAPQQTIVSKSGPGAARPAITPTAPAAPVAPVADPVAEAKRYRDDAAAKLDAAEKARRVHAAEARKFADDKKGIGAKLSEYEQLKKYEAEQKRIDGQAKLNKAAFLESKFGKDWYEQIVQERLNGGAPTADTVALEVTKVREEFAQQLADRDAARAKEIEAEKSARIEAQLQDVKGEISTFATTHAEKFPAVTTRYSAQQLVEQVLALARQEFEQGGADKVRSYGEILADLEKAEVEMHGKLTERLKPANTPPVAPGTPQLRRTEVERRTLSNGLTATTPGQKQTLRSDEERRAAAFAAVERLKSAGA